MKMRLFINSSPITGAPPPRRPVYLRLGLARPELSLRATPERRVPGTTSNLPAIFIYWHAFSSD